MSDALVSAVIPAYNCGLYVAAAVESALGQTHRAIEVIVVDDGSTDDTRERVAPYAGRIRYIHQENRGLPGARNTGIRAARGEWVALLDADDLWHREKTEAQLRAVAGLGGVALVGSPPARELPDRLPADPEVRWLTLRDFLVAAPASGSSALIRRACLEETGLFDESLKSAEDRDMWLRLSARFPAAQVAADCWWYRPHPNQMSRNPRRMYDNYTRVLDKFFTEHPEHRRYRAVAYGYLYFDAALAYQDHGDDAAAKSFLLRSLARWPLPFGGPNLSDRGRRAKVILRLALGERLFRGILALRCGPVPALKIPRADGHSIAQD